MIDYAAPGPLTGLASVSPPALDLPGDRFAENQLRPAAALAGALCVPDLLHAAGRQAALSR